MRIRFFAFVIVILALSVSICMANTEAVIDVEISEPEIFVRDNVVFARYYTWPQAELKMDIYSPSDNEKHPALIFIPGGCWITSPKIMGAQLCMKLAQNNFVAASIEYRVTSAVSYPEIIGDAKAAVRYVRAHADELHVDPNRIAVMGASAGGYLAAMLGVTGNTDKFDFGDNLNQSSKVQAVIDFFGITDMTRTADDYDDAKKAAYYSASSFFSIFVNGTSGYKDKKGGSVLDTPDTARDSNPLNYIDENTPPFLIFHGNADKTVSLSQSKILHDALTEHKIDSTFYIMNGGEHASIYFYQPQVFNRIVDFLNRVLK